MKGEERRSRGREGGKGKGGVEREGMERGQGRSGGGGR